MRTSTIFSLNNFHFLPYYIRSLSLIFQLQLHIFYKIKLHWISFFPQNTMIFLLSLTFEHKVTLIPVSFLYNPLCYVSMVYYLRNSGLYCRNRQPSNQSIIKHQRFKIFSCKLCCWLRKLPREFNLHVRKVFMSACAVMIAGAGEERRRELSPSNYIPILGKTQ